MAAYAALASVLNIIDTIHNHPHPPFLFYPKQVESLYENAAFLLDFLESYSHGGIEGLEGWIADAAYAAEDIIESAIVDQIHAGSNTASHRKKTSCYDFYEDQRLHKVTLDLEFIKKYMMEFCKEKTGFQYQLQQGHVVSSSTSPPSVTAQSSAVGLDDVLTDIMDKLTGHHSARIIPIVGMGGIGKTTLARNVYLNPHIVHYFDIRAWATISQEYSVHQVLIDLILCVNTEESREKLSLIKEEHKLGEKLYKSLSGRRYFVVIDDLWNNEAWDAVKTFFPTNNSESRIIITTRLSNVAFQVGNVFEMEFLSHDNSWDLLCKTVFGDEKSCPFELEGTGKKIANNCKGLPLSIVVIGGLLANSNKTKEHWESIAGKTTVLNLEANELCLNLLQTSYDQLPAHLKPCFMYMGIFPEDREIRVSRLIKLWIAEGFLRTNKEKVPEVVAEEYFNELIHRNLILVHNRGSTGKIKSCNMHDLLRELSLKQAQKEKFFCVARDQNHNVLQDMCTQRRIGIHLKAWPAFLYHIQPQSVTRSLIYNFHGGRDVPLHEFRLLRVLQSLGPYRNDHYVFDAISQLVNSRFFEFKVANNIHDFKFPSSTFHLWNLQTLIVKNHSLAAIAPPEIWKMAQLRHVQFLWLILPDPPSGDDLVLRNLQTLSVVEGFIRYGEEVDKRIPNIKKLKVRHCECDVNRFGRLNKLESLGCYFIIRDITFPHSLKKLSLSYSYLLWEDMVMTKIGSLPHLEVLKLGRYAFKGSVWETVEGQFRSLKYLKIVECYDLEYWRTDSTHFPCLENLVLQNLRKLKEIPSSIGEIPTLESIQLDYCCDSVVVSAKEILDAQEDLGNEHLRVRVRVRYLELIQTLGSLSSPHFQVERYNSYLEDDANDEDEGGRG